MKCPLSVEPSILTSSAKEVRVDFRSAARLLIKRRNILGPNTNPFGTPLATSRFISWWFHIENLERHGRLNDQILQGCCKLQGKNWRTDGNEMRAKNTGRALRETKCLYTVTMRIAGSEFN